ncbi:F-box protein MAX2-like [Tasmannia lanceolata]|uniref:F-box protein MAX2-like n=1 Tax=Tasmannia lanceolata TaxID=3420 RepID=UPI0040636878
MPIEERQTHLHDLPEAILTIIFASILNLKTRNAMALVSHKWLALERSTRTSLNLFVNKRNLFPIPTCFQSVTHVHLFLSPPCDFSFLKPSSSSSSPFDPYLLIAHRFSQAFTSLTSLTLTVYSPTLSTFHGMPPFPAAEIYLGKSNVLPDLPKHFQPHLSLIRFSFCGIAAISSGIASINPPMTGIGSALTFSQLDGIDGIALCLLFCNSTGDCRTQPKPAEPAFGLSSLTCYPRLSKMKLDCGDLVGYALTAPPRFMDLSLRERFYQNGIGNINLGELDYWHPQDRDVNHSSLSLPAAGLLGECSNLRELFIHGTAHEHFMKFLLNIPNLRDVRLREDYYPALENDMSSEMRVDSCSRFEDALNRHRILD